jgi:DNA-binding transcriptional regulator YhcF (GntR family)
MPAFITIDLDDSEPAFRQIAAAIRAQLVTGEHLGPGDRLPPVRRLARELGVHHNTVAEAYRLLAAEGWLELKQGRGAQIRERQLPTSDDTTRVRYRRRLEEVLFEALAAGIDKEWLISELDALQGKVES